LRLDSREEGHPHSPRCRDRTWIQEVSLKVSATAPRMGWEGFLKIPEVGRPIRYQPNFNYLRRADNDEGVTL